MSRPLVRIPVDPAPPGRTDVVVIGGGIIGLTTAYFLASRGVSVTVLEKGHVAGEQSSRNLGWCRTTGRAEVEMPLMLESMALWRDANRLTEAETGFRQSGLLYGFPDARAAEAKRSWLDTAGRFGLDTRVIEGDELRAMLPGGTGQPPCAVFTATDGRAEPSLAGPAFAAAARRHGAVIVEEYAVRGIDLKAGRVAGLHGERGFIACDCVVVAAGAWSRMFLHNQGLFLPQLMTQASVMRTTPVEGLPDVVSTIGSYAFNKRLDGGYTISSAFSSIADIVPDSFRLLRHFLPALWAERKHTSLRIGRQFVTEMRRRRRWKSHEASPFESHRVLDPVPAPSHLDRPFADLCADFPAFRQAEIVDRWAGSIDATPDFIPVISTVAAVPGLVVSTGYSGHGFGIGPGAGRLTADIVQGRSPGFDPKPFRFDRFGSPRLFRRGASSSERL